MPVLPRLLVPRNRHLLPLALAAPSSPSPAPPVTHDGGRPFPHHGLGPNLDSAQNAQNGPCSPSPLPKYHFHPRAPLLPRYAHLAAIPHYELVSPLFPAAARRSVPPPGQVAPPPARVSPRVWAVVRAASAFLQPLSIRTLPALIAESPARPQSLSCPHYANPLARAIPLPEAVMGRPGRGVASHRGHSAHTLCEARCSRAEPNQGEAATRIEESHAMRPH
jgi:hypothetical protein